MVVECHVPALEDDVVPGTRFGLDPDWDETRIRIPLKEGEGQDVTSSACEEDPVRERPAANGVALGARISKHVQGSDSSSVRLCAAETVES